MTRYEDRFLAIAQNRMPDGSARILWPRRNLRIRRGGQWKNSLAPVFPGYLFLQAESVDPALFATVRKAPGFIRFLLSNDNITALGKKDQELLSHFLSFGEIVDRSIATFDENRRIRILAGPLKGLEGKIVKVDRRKGRAKVKLEMYEDSFSIDFGFDSLEAATTPQSTPS
jgi:transcriptional antiterminator NusG